MGFTLWLIVVFICGGAGGEPRVCPVEAEDRSQHLLYRPVTSLGLRCIQQLVKNESLSRLESTMPLEEVRAFFRAFCRTRSSIRSCFQEHTCNLEVCQNEQFLNAFNIFQDFLETVTDYGCEQEGEHFSILFHGGIRAISNSTTNLPFGNCIWKSSVIIKEIENTTIDYPSKFFVLSQELTKLKKCLHEVNLELNFKKVLESALDHTHHHLKCIHPASGTLVLCKDINRTEIHYQDSCQVFFGGKNAEKKKLYDLYDEGTSDCFQQLMILDKTRNNTTRTIRLLQHEIAEFCFKGTVRMCILKKSILSHCFTATQQSELKMIEGFVTDAVNVLCAYNGHRMASILFEVYRLKRSVPGRRRNVLAECVAEGKEATRDSLGDHGYETSTVRFYLVLGRLKGCLLHRLSADETAHRDAQLLLEELLRTAECVHPLTGVKLLCSSFVHD